MLIKDYASNAYGAGPAEHQLFGVEIEVENAPDNTYPRGRGSWVNKFGWNLTGDGSLRDGGLELISQPSDMRTLVRAFRTHCNWAKEYDWRASIRTSIHVHANMLSRTMSQVQGIAAAYAAFEPLMFQLVGPEREEGIYCVPWYRAPSEAGVLTCGDDHAAWHAAPDSCKYSALYVAPLHRFGTIEFRAAPSWMEPAPMIRWLCAINRLIRWGQDQSPLSVLEQCQGDVNGLVHEIFGRTMAEVMDPESLMDEVDSLGVVETMLPCTYKVTDWDWQPAPAAIGGLGYHRQVRR